MHEGIGQYRVVGNSDEGVEKSVKALSDFTNNGNSFRKYQELEFFDESVISILLTEQNDDGYKINEEICDILIARGLPVNENEKDIQSFTRNTALEFIRDSKQRIITEIKQLLSDIYADFYGDNIILKRAVSSLRTPIDISKYRLSNESSREIFSAEIVRKLTFGFSEELFIDEIELAQDLSFAVKEKYFKCKNLEENQEKAILKTMQRFIRIEIFGAEYNMFNNKVVTPPTYKDARCTFFKNLKKSLNSQAEVSASQVCKASPWTYQLICTLTESKKKELFAKIIIDVFHATLRIKPKFISYKSEANRREFFETELRKAKGDPRNICLVTINNSAKTLRRYYSTDGQELDVKETLIALIDEFYLDGCPEFFKYYIRARKNRALNQGLILKYLNPEKSSHYYKHLLDSATTVRILKQLKDQLEASFKKGESVAMIASYYGVGKKGIESLYCEYRETGAVKLTGRDKTLEILNYLKADREMLSADDLISEFMENRTIKLLRGISSIKKLSFKFLPLNSNGLESARDLISAFETNSINLNIEEKIEALEEIKDSLTTALSEEEKSIIDKKKSSQLMYQVTNENLIKLISLINNILVELKA